MRQKLVTGALRRYFTRPPAGLYYLDTPHFPHHQEGPMNKPYVTPQLSDFGTVAQLTGVTGNSSAQDVFINHTSSTIFGFPPGTTEGTGSVGGCWDSNQGQTCNPQTS